MHRGLERSATPERNPTNARGVHRVRGERQRGREQGKNLPDVIFLVDKVVLRYHAGQLRGRRGGWADGDDGEDVKGTGGERTLAVRERTKGFGAKMR